MKIFFPTVLFGLLIAVILFSGCASTSQPVETLTYVPTPTVIVTAVDVPSPMPTPAQYPGALTLDQYATFGSGNMQGKATIYRYEVRPNYNWTSPSWNSPQEQAAASPPLELQRGYNLETPQQGNTFLFVYVRVQNTGDKAVYAPSANQFVVSIDGKMYNYSSVHSSDVIIDKVSGTQYDYQIGRGGTVGYVLPGESNVADGYLIYEIPAPFTPGMAFVVSNLDFQNKAVWKLG